MSHIMIYGIIIIIVRWYVFLKLTTVNIVFMDDAESIIAELSSRPQAEMIMNS